MLYVRRPNLLGDSSSLRRDGWLSLIDQDMAQQRLLRTLINHDSIASGNRFRAPQGLIQAHKSLAYC